MTEKPHDDFREHLYTINKDGSRKWVYTQSVTGFYSRVRTVVATVLLLIYISLPWLSVGGEQAVLLNIPARKFTFFGVTLWATDTQYLFLALGVLGACLFFFTALAGRVWCGWACPETVFLEFVFRPIEKWIEGDGAKRLRLDQSPWTWQKIWKKSLKFFIFSLIAWFLASTALAYFVGREELINMMLHPPTENWSTFLTTVVFMALLLFQFGWFREQFCTAVCPYARFQSVLMDKHSLQVGYDPLRGEPRGKRKKNTDEAAFGDCVDCGMCVRVCPTGIDIRNGLQLECIQCANCIDACDSIMEKVGKPLGLIRYDSEASLLDRLPTQWFRPRVFLYTAFLAAFSIALIYSVGTREESEWKVLRAKDVPFSYVSETTISNHLDLRISNKSKSPQKYSIHVTGPVNVSFITPVNPYLVPPDTIVTTPLFLHFPRELVAGGAITATIHIATEGGFQEQKEVTLLGPKEGTS